MAAVFLNGMASRNLTETAFAKRKRDLRRVKSTLGRPIQCSPVLPGLRGLRVLVVDNEQDSANELARRMYAWGHNPLTARDVYDALRSQRPYKAAFDHLKTMNIITHGDGRTQPEHFDAAIFDTFQQNQLSFRDIFESYTA